MCTLAFCHKRKLTYTEFKNCNDANEDGVGFAFSRNGKQYLIKGFMTFDTAWNFYKKVPEGKAHIVHFRLSTAGTVVPQLTHPFICSDASPLHTEYEGNEPLLFHNGMVSGWKELALTNRVLTHSLMSDTRYLAIMLGRNGIENYKEHLKNTHGKFIIFHSGKAKLIGDFIYDKGVYFSNSSYKYSYTSKYNYKYDAKKYDVGKSVSPETTNNAYAYYTREQFRNYGYTDSEINSYFKDLLIDEEIERKKETQYAEDYFAKTCSTEYKNSKYKKSNAKVL